MGVTNHQHRPELGRPIDGTLGVKPQRVCELRVASKEERWQLRASELVAELLGSHGVEMAAADSREEVSRMGSRDRDRDREHLIPSAPSLEDGVPYKPSPTSSSTSSSSPATSSISTSHNSGQEALGKVIQSWASKKFMTGCVILFPIAITFYITWWFVHFVDGFFSPIYAHLGIDIFGLGFMTSITFIFAVGIFMSSWLGVSLLGMGEWFIKRMPLIRHIYSALKQISAAISPDQESKAFKEVAIIRHPRVGEYALGFITSTVILKRDTGAEELCCVYVPTNHLYVGDMYLINWRDIIRPKLSVREGIEIVVSGGLSVPQVLATLEARSMNVDVFKLKCASP